MSEFSIYLQLGFQHITDWRAYDHMLFLLALCAVYQLADWRRVLIMVTAFTFGHSLTLALTIFEVTPSSPPVVEFLIPLTIFLTAVFNFLPTRNRGKDLIFTRYPMAFAFGLIHGMGFSGYLQSLLGTGANIVRPLLAFNLGLEIGQVLIVVAVLAVAWAFGRFLKVPSVAWNYVISGFAAAISLVLLVEHRIW